MKPQLTFEDMVIKKIYNSDGPKFKKTPGLILEERWECSLNP
jgi:hypothetical protein